MCPDRQVISLYYDDELPSPWKEKMEAHLEVCPECKAELARYRQLGEKIKSLDFPSIEEAEKRVWNKINSNRIIIKNNDKFWSKKISMPLPAAAAALFILAFSIIFLIMRPAGTNESIAMDQARPIPAEWSGTLLGDDLGTVLPTLDMDDFIHFLLSENDGDFVVVRLPETSRFSRTGQPALINAADYSRSRSNR
ncbi:MAG: zf-HC2 domain-containing protein [Treponema sp.]|nr:zf-HC2 domain-containing protein [Treponema sp.]